MHVQKGKVLCESPAALQVAACAKPQSSFAPRFTPRGISWTCGHKPPASTHRADGGLHRVKPSMPRWLWMTRPVWRWVNRLCKSKGRGVERSWVWKSNRLVSARTQVM